MASGTVVYRYPRRALLADDLRAGFGTFVGALVTFNPDALIGIRVAFAVILAIFLFFGWRTLERHWMKVAVNEEGIFTKAFSLCSIPWDGLESLKLRHYGSRRQVKEGRGGFYQLTLKGNGGSMSFESSIEGFQDIAWFAARALRGKDGAVDPVSASHLLAFEIDPDEETRRPRLEGEGEEL